MSTESPILQRYERWAQKKADPGKVETGGGAAISEVS
jgi:hypothetical protein